MSRGASVAEGMEGRITRMFRDGMNYREIAGALGLTKGVVAGRCRRLGLVRNPDRVRRARPGKPKPSVVRPEVIGPAEIAERAQDMRDLDILSDLAEGHTITETARHWGVSAAYIDLLRQHAREAA